MEYFGQSRDRPLENLQLVWRDRPKADTFGLKVNFISKTSLWKAVTGMIKVTLVCCLSL